MRVQPGAKHKATDALLKLMFEDYITNYYMCGPKKPKRERLYCLIAV